ncbi:MAG: TlpA family protein disulfide reductase [Gammaproteobacteria bacterium]|nr:TlpA family protein disulfide reductase [Gammaproteobacteria bacterium]
MSIKNFIVSMFIPLILSVAFVQTVSATEIIDFSLKDLQGSTHTAKQYRGKWVVVNYWGVFCAPCLREMPELSVFHDKHKNQDAVVLGINQEEFPEDKLALFGEKMKITFPLFKVPFEQTTPFGSVALLPTTFIINPQGELVARQQGAITGKLLEDYIDLKTAHAKQEKVITK